MADGNAGGSPAGSPKGGHGDLLLDPAADAQKPVQSSGELRTRTAVLLLVAIFLTSAAALAAVYFSFPKLEPDEVAKVKFPSDIEDAKQLGLVLSRYKDRYFLQVLGGVCVTYLFLQTFAIPGSISLSIVSGFLFPFPIALLLICFCSATGASFCYLLSYLVGRRLVNRYLPQRAAEWKEKVDQHRDNMLSYIIFLRITPFLPNWFINITSPVLGVSLYPFWFGTFIGVAPPSLIAIQAGITLQQLTSTMEVFTVKNVALLAFAAIVSIAPPLFKNRKSILAFLTSCRNVFQNLPRRLKNYKKSPGEEAEVENDEQDHSKTANLRPSSSAATQLSELPMTEEAATTPTTCSTD